MIRWLLAQLEANPRCRFAETVLRQRDAASFESLCSGELLLPVAEYAPTLVRDGRLLTVEQLADGSLEAFDAEDPEYGVRILQEDEVTLWEVDRQAVAGEIAIRNGIVPQPTEVTDRIDFVGDADDGVAVVLVWIPGREEAESLLPLLPATFPKSTRGLIAVCPSFRPSPQFARVLEGLRVHVTNVCSDELDVFPSIRTCVARLDNLAPGLADAASGFKLAPDLRHASVGGKNFALTAMQGRVVKAMLDAHLSGSSELHQSHLLRSAGSTSDELRAIFKRSPAWKSLIVPGSRPGTFRLNL